MPRDEIAKLIRETAARAGCDTYYALAKASGVHLQTARSLWLGTSSPSLDTLERVFGAIGYRVDLKIVKQRKTK